MTRKFARRFNNFYGVEYFKEPVAYNFGKELVKIPGLDGSGKMGKSEGNAIYLSDTPKEIEKKVKKALTDSGPTIPNSVDRKSTRLNSSHVRISYAVFCLKKKKKYE